MATIVEYTDRKKAESWYPKRIISPTRPQHGCFSDTQELGPSREAARWVFQYKRCRHCWRELLVRPPERVRPLAPADWSPPITCCGSLLLRLLPEPVLGTPLPGRRRASCPRCGAEVLLIVNPDGPPPPRPGPRRPPEGAGRRRSSLGRRAGERSPGRPPHQHRPQAREGGRHGQDPDRRG
jgi:hypothetical protein